MCAYNFIGLKYIANTGCMASMAEAKMIGQKVARIPVKDKKKKWEPSCCAIFDAIKENTILAINDIANKKIIAIDEPCTFKIELFDDFVFKEPERISWKGRFEEREAFWESPSVEI